MQHHKLDFRNKSPLEHIIMGERLVASADALPEEQRQNIPLEKLRGVTVATRASHERIASLRTALKTEISNRRALLAQLRLAATGTALGLTINAKFQPAAMLAAGLELSAPHTTRIGLPAAPLNLHAAPTDNEGEAKLRWQRTVRRCAFEVQWHTDPPDAEHWQQEVICLKQKFLVKGLVSGGKYWFRVRADNAHGQSAWSQLASVRVK